MQTISCILQLNTLQLNNNESLKFKENTISSFKKKRQTKAKYLILKNLKKM